MARAAMRHRGVRDDNDIFEAIYNDDPVYLRESNAADAVAMADLNEKYPNLDYHMAKEELSGWVAQVAGLTAWLEKNGLTKG